MSDFYFIGIIIVNLFRNYLAQKNTALHYLQNGIFKTKKVYDIDFLYTIHLKLLLL